MEHETQDSISWISLYSDDYLARKYNVISTDMRMKAKELGMYRK